MALALTIPPHHRVLVPTDFSDPATAVQQAILPWLHHPSQLHILHILLPLQTMEPGAIWQTVKEEDRIRQVQETFQQRFPQPPYRDVHFQVLVGNPSLKIIDYAKIEQIDLIVMASHGRTGLARFLLGSVTEKVVRTAPCPVLVWR